MLTGHWRRNEVRVLSAEHKLTEWDDLGDKNSAYYTGERYFVVTDPKKYAVPVCNAHPQKAWWYHSDEKKKA